ncbi:MAG: class I SAM-dependent methyltransferase [Nitrospirae bacterium]|nr:class I SAM-dependent methyltransferase [Nitrospirota bacterium]
MYHLDFADIRRCRVCDLAFLDPVPQQDFLEDFYNNESYFTKDHLPYFGECFKGYSMDSITIRDFRKVLNRLPDIPNGKLLDIGCATGVFLDLARKKGWNTRGVELSKWASGYARENFGLDVFTGTLEQTYFPDQSFDVVTAWDVLEHLPNPVVFLKEIKRILKKDGTLYINTICYRSILNYVGHLAYRLSFGRIKYPLYHLYGIHHIYYFSRKSLTWMIENSGFKVTDITMAEYQLERVDTVPSIIKAGMYILYMIQGITGLKTVVTATAIRQ